ncbi:bidirectional sugar transporter SWEET10-like [Benincasa hispida]|uniref:bidirectional sugar transporter SWEET10-like n=1 Tax=Benincasa hispida TaxID=102211 RepID=UPI0019018FEE|nr:bidirectional sugar transporter SWEET10-like [Benincasa hispida]
MAISPQTLAFVFGLLGNIISFMVFLAPLPTFYKIYKKKSAEGYQSVPYVVALFSAMLWIYYALLKTNATFLITINSFGCVIETLYILLFIFYAPTKLRFQTAKVILLLNVLGFGLMLALTMVLAKGEKRLKVLGWICLVFNLSVFAAPLFIMGKVIKTKSVEYMPFALSFFLTLNAVMWFFYGLLLKDYYIALPNVVGFVFGIIQMILYVIFKNCGANKGNNNIPIKDQAAAVAKPPQLHELSEQIIDAVKLGTMVCTELNPVAVLQPNVDVVDVVVEAVIDNIQKKKDQDIITN